MRRRKASPLPRAGLGAESPSAFASLPHLQVWGQGVWDGCHTWVGVVGRAMGFTATTLTVPHLLASSDSGGLPGWVHSGLV